MPASENQAAETSKDADDMKADSPWNIIHIRLPTRKRLPDASLILSKKLPRNTTNVGSKEVPEPITDNLGKNLITVPVQGEAGSHSPRAGLWNEASSNIMSKTLSAESESDTSGDKLLELNEANVSTLYKNLGVAAEEQGSDASSYAAEQGLCEEANNNKPSMILALPVQELPEDNNVSSPSKNHATTGKQGEVERIYSPRKKLFYNTDSKLAGEEGNSPKWNITITTEEMFEGANHPIPTKLSDEVKNNAPSIIPSDPANKSSPHKRLTSLVQATGTRQKTPGMNLSASVSQAVEQSANTANMDITKMYQATEAKTNPSRTLSTTAMECEMFEHANHAIRTKKLSDVARNKAPSNKPTDPAKKSTPRKKPLTSAVQATVASQNTSTMRLPISDGLAVKQSKCAADLEAIKQYQQFEEKVKRTVYLDNLSHQATESVIKSALSQFCTIRKVIFVVNYTIAYNIPQSALIEMETQKDAEVVVSMLHDFPFMMSGMPRPVRAIHATAEMFNDRPRRPGSKLKFRWVGHTDPDYKMVKKLKLLSRKHEVENLALIEHELEEEKLLAAKQQENLNVSYEMMETMDSVLMSGMSNYLSSIYNVNWNDVFSNGY